ncbi:MAG TPA: argininosuccinate synthase [Desulfobacteria bacterium]|nr:argininosuccinate synthase [Desulfobacteria bacterium]
MKKVVLAYSGGLDTSVCIPLLREQYGYDEVIAVLVDVGQPEADIKEGVERGEKLSDSFRLVDANDEFVRDYIFRLIKANGSYEGYVLGTAIARPLIAKKVVEVAKEENAEAVAHGCTGKGNDQLRFDAVFRATDLDVIAPVRELSLTREEEKKYAAEHGIAFGAEKRWSIDENIWSRSIEGSELEDPAFFPPEEIFQWTVSQDNAPDAAEIVKIGFERGIPVSVNGKSMDGVTLIKELNRMGGKHGVGRTDIIEDRVLGFKARENYEHPAATILLEAHRDLERLVLTRTELKFKDCVDQTWSELVYQGLVMDPLYDDLNAFVDKTQERVTGTVFMRLNKGVARVVGRESPNALYSAEVSFDAKQETRIVEGFSIYYGFQSRMYRKSLE